MPLNANASIFVPSFSSSDAFVESSKPKHRKGRRNRPPPKGARRKLAITSLGGATDELSGSPTTETTPERLSWGGKDAQYIKEKLAEADEPDADEKDDVFQGLDVLKRKERKPQSTIKKSSSLAEEQPRRVEAKHEFQSMDKLRLKFWELLRSRQPLPAPVSEQKEPEMVYYSVFDPVPLANSASVIVKEPVLLPKADYAEPEDYAALLWSAVDDEDLHQVEELLIDVPPLRSAKRPSTGNYILHEACARSAEWVQAVLSAVGKHQRLFFVRNNKGEAVFHLACQQERSEVLELLLSSQASPGSLQKGLAALDTKGKTPLLSAIHANSLDNVATLLMWHGNSTTSVVEMSPGRCPLVEAVSIGASPELIDLLLEFSPPNKQVYNMWEALYLCVTSDEGQASQDTFLYLDKLIDAGANPCRTDNPRKTSLLTIMCQRNDPENVIEHLINRYQARLSRSQAARRRDVILQKQPESFFAGLESRENAEMKATLCDALVTSLFKGWQQKSIHFFQSATLLFRLGARLGEHGAERLEVSIRTNRLVPMKYIESGESIHSSLNYSAKYKYLPVDLAKSSEPSKALRNLLLDSGMDRQINCPVMRRLCGPQRVLREADVVLRTIDGRHFECHSEIVGAKSAKLEAAVDFARRQGKEEVMLDINCSSELAVSLLEHIYHGSLIGVQSSTDSCDNDELLLSLLVLSRDLICPMLGLECILRLLTRDQSARCFCSGCAKDMHRADGWIFTCPSLLEGPSDLITAENVLDFMSVAEELEQSHILEGISITVGTRGNQEHVVDSLTLLRTECSWYILLNFDSVAKIQELDVRLEAKDDANADAGSLLLEFCMDEISRMPWMSVVASSISVNAQTKNNNY